MKPIKIITDSCADLEKELMDEYDIDYVKMNIIYDGKQLPATLTWDDVTPHQMYEHIRQGNRVMTTQVPVEEYNRVFGEYAGKGYDIIYIGCSVKQSGSVNTAAVVAKKMMNEAPDLKIACINSKNSSFGIGMLAIEASKMAKDGADFDTVTEKINGMLKKVLQFCTVHTLEYMRRAGRVKGSSAFFGNLLGVKPILISDADGTQTPLKKVKGRAASIKECVALLKENIIEPENQTVYFAHADCSDDEVKYIADLVKAEINCKDVHIGYIGPIIGASVGPDAIVLFAFGKEVTYRVGDN